MGQAGHQREKKMASRFYQLKSGHALTGVYLKCTGNRPDGHCWWCDPENIGTRQTRDHLFKHCYKWKDQPAVMWARVKEGEAEVARGRPSCSGGRRGEASGVVTRALLVLGSLLCFLSVFSNCVLSLVWASLVSHAVSPRCSLSQRTQFVGGGGARVLPSSPIFGPERQTGTG